MRCAVLGVLLGLVGWLAAPRSQLQNRRVFGEGFGSTSIHAAAAEPFMLVCWSVFRS